MSGPLEAGQRLFVRGSFPLSDRLGAGASEATSALQFDPSTILFGQRGAQRRPQAGHSPGKPFQLLLAGRGAHPRESLPSAPGHLPAASTPLLRG